MKLAMKIGMGFLVPEHLWCKCLTWRDHYDTLANLAEMTGCIFCGRQLLKGDFLIPGVNTRTEIIKAGGKGRSS